MTERSLINSSTTGRIKLLRAGPPGGFGEGGVPDSQVGKTGKERGEGLKVMVFRQLLKRGGRKEERMG